MPKQKQRLVVYQNELPVLRTVVETLLIAIITLVFWTLANDIAGQFAATLATIATHVLTLLMWGLRVIFEMIHKAHAAFKKEGIWAYL